MDKISVEQFADKIDSLYRLVIVAAHRATHVGKPDSRALVPVRSRKATMVALEEILEGKVGYRIIDSDDEEYEE